MFHFKILENLFRNSQVSSLELISHHNFPRGLPEKNNMLDNLYYRTTLLFVFLQATNGAASHNQLWPFPLPYRSHNNHHSFLESNGDGPSQPNRSGRSQTSYSASQPG